MATVAIRVPVDHNMAHEPTTLLSPTRALHSRTLCFTEAQKDPTILCNREKLTEFYLQEVALMQARRKLHARHETKDADTKLGVPTHIPAVLQPAGSRKTIRIVQWNVNVLHGADNVKFARPQQATAIAEVLKELDADVLLLQEAWKLSYPEGKAPNWPDSSRRVRDLIELLPSLGYQIVACEEENNFNPSILATRLPIVEAGEAFSTDEGRHDFADAMQAQRSPEMRAARIVDLALGNTPEERSAGAPVLTTVITHFHHNEAPAAPEFGIRRGEASAIIAECDKWALKHRRRSARSRCSATLVATDFNGVRKSDLAPHEWKLHAECMAKLGQPADDGVAAQLERNGFQCTYDAPGMKTPPLTHWTNTVLDFAYLRTTTARDQVAEQQDQERKHNGDGSSPDANGQWAVQGVYVVPTTVSDHLPVVHDLLFEPSMQ